jgi:predicted chitinase/LAS superfamily LD-carboxypeptidase LdcB
MSISAIKPYKFVNPNMITGGLSARVKKDGEKGGATIIAAGKKITGPKEEGPAAVKAGRTTLLAFNRIGFTLYSIGKAQSSWAKLVVGEGKLIKENTAFRRRKKQYLRDQEAEAKQESSPGLKPIKEEGKKAVDKKEKKEQSWLEKLFAPFKGLIEFALRIAITQGVLRWVADPKNYDKIQVFVDNAAKVFNFLFNIAYKSIDFFLTGVSNVLGNGEAQGFDRFKQVMTGLGQILIGIAGFKALSYLNPFNLVGDLLKLIDWFSGNTGAQDVLPQGDVPDGKPDAPGAKPKPRAATQKIAEKYGDDAAKYYDDLISRGKSPVQALQTVRGKFKPIPPKPKGALAKIGDKFADMKKGFMGGLESGKKGLLAGWENVKKIGGSISKSVRDKLARSAEWAKKGVTDKLKPIAKGAYDILEKKGIVKNVKKLGVVAKESIQKVPGYSKVMKKVSEEGGQAMLKKIGGKAIPVIGGLVNLYFAYDRLKSGDKSGAALEALSAILDLSGLFGFAPGPALSMALDAYLFGRDFFPDVVKKENEYLDKMINGILGPIKSIQDMLPKIPMLAEGGIIKKPTLAVLGERGPEAVVPLDGSRSSSDQLAATIISSIQGSMDRMGPGGEVAKQLLAGQLGGIKNSLGVGSVLSVGGGESISKTVSLTQQRIGKDTNVDPAELLVGTRNPSFGVGKTANSMTTLRGGLANLLGVFSEISTKDLSGGKKGSGSSSGPSGDDSSGDSSDGASANINLTNTEYTKLMIETMDKGGLTDNNERIMFMAQVGHESGDGRYMEEIHDGSNYEGRRDLGNTQPGDGKRYKGRGYIQITGRSNYKTYGPKAGVPDAEKNPHKLAEPKNAAKVALAYWLARVNRGAAKKGMAGMETVTRNINGGLNGLKDRIAKFKKYEKMDSIKKAAAGGLIPYANGGEFMSAEDLERKSKTAKAPGNDLMDKSSNVKFDSRAFGGTLSLMAKGGQLTFNGFKNGDLPKSQLTSIGHGAFLHKNAAAKWEELVAAAKKDGVSLKPGGPGGYAYRDYAEQQALVKKYGLWSPSNPGAAHPGTSNHGWGAAVDVASNGYAWIGKNAKKFGWRGISNEAWHIDLPYKDVLKGAVAPAGSDTSGDTTTTKTGDDTSSGADTEEKSKEQILAEMAAAIDKVNNMLYGTPIPNSSENAQLPDKVWINKKTGEVSLKEPPADKKSEYEEKKTAELSAEQKEKAQKLLPKTPPKTTPSGTKPTPTPGQQTPPTPGMPPGALVAGQRPDKALTREQFRAVQQARAAAAQMGLTGMDKERFIAKAAMNAGSSGASLSQASQSAQVSQTIEDSAVTTVPVPINTGSSVTMVGGHTQTQVIRPQSQITRGFG